MTRLLTITTFLLFASTAFGQTDPCPVMPEGYLCLPRSVAVKALEDADARKALEAQVKDMDIAYDKLRDALADMRVNYATAAGENSILKQRAISDAALIELLTKMVRPKKIGLNLF